MNPRLAGFAPFVTVFVVFVIYLRALGDPHFYYDAANYWSLGGTFGRAGHFSLLDFHSTTRGYALPLLNRGLSAVGSHLGISSVAVVQIFGSLEIALLGTVLVPRLVRALWPTAALTPLRILLFNAIIFIFWRDHLGFPLSDFPAITLTVGALLALTRRSPTGYLIAGFAIGLAWNVRQAYIVTLIVMAILVVVRSGIRRTPQVASGVLALFVIGVAIALLPQALINHRHEQSWTPQVLGGSKIALQDLTYGMRAQRYETNVGAEYPVPGVFYVDPSTRALLVEKNITALSSFTEYGGIVVHHPTVMIAAWARRLFDGLDVRYATPYIHDLDATSEWFSLLNYSLLFIALARLLVPTLRRSIGRVAWPETVAFCGACLPAVPFAVEARFFLPLQFGVYALAVFTPDARATWSDLQRSGKVTLALLYPTFLFLCVALSTATVALIAIPLS